MSFYFFDMWTYVPTIVLPENTTTQLYEWIQEHKSHISVSKRQPADNPQFLFCGEGLQYQYFDQKISGLPFPTMLNALALDASKRVDSKNVGLFNAAFINFYPNGQSIISRHQDKTHSDDPIVSYSFYEEEEKTSPAEERTFVITDKEKQVVAQFPLSHNSILIMKSEMHKQFWHEIPSSSAKKWRINVTFRVHKQI